ncbi:MAG: CHAD domain-containing protein [Bacteroidales bacterium]|nr:CHAD domain-containing protein [Bacteroidales bacterium]
MELDYVKLKEIKPALAGYIRDSQALIRKLPAPDAKAVHDIRVLMKKSRAVMRLISNQVDKEFYERQYSAFREVGIKTRLWRETSVHRKTLKGLKKNYPDVLTELINSGKFVELLKKPGAPGEAAPEMKDEIEIIEDILNKTGYRVRFQSLNNLDPKMLIKELEATYILVVDRYLDCRNNLKPTKIHEFRKRSKDFLYQLYFFRPLNPSVIKSLEKKLNTMTQNLGKYNDLVQLIKTLDYRYKGPSDFPALDEFIIILREEQDRYLSGVWPQACKIFCPGQNLINVLGFRILMI